MVDGDAVGKTIVEIMRGNTKTLGNIVAVDGKAIRSTSKKDKAHFVFANIDPYATESGVTIGQDEDVNNSLHASAKDLIIA